MVEAARPATRDDLPRLVELARQAVEELRPTRGGAMWARREARQEPIDEGLATALDRDDHSVLAGTIDETVVGYAVSRLVPLAGEGLLAEVTDLYVEPGCREVGVGELLMDAIVTWAETHGCVGIDSLVLPGNRETKNFFETFGLVARAIIVHRPLGQGA